MFNNDFKYCSLKCNYNGSFPIAVSDINDWFSFFKYIHVYVCHISKRVLQVYLIVLVSLCQISMSVQATLAVTVVLVRTVLTCGRVTVFRATKAIGAKSVRQLECKS